MIYFLIISSFVYFFVKLRLSNKIDLFDSLLVFLLFVVYFYQRIKNEREKKNIFIEYQKEKDFVFEILQILRSTLELDKLLEKILNIFSSKIGHKNIFIYLLEKDNNQMEYLKCIGFPGAINIKGIDILNIYPGSKLIDIIVNHKESEIIDLSSSIYQVEKNILHFDKIGVVPMRIMDKIIGAIIFEISSPDIKFFDLELLATHSAMAIDNAKLFEQVKESAITDNLTKVYNRRYLDRTLSSSIELAKRYKSYLSILMIDIDDFKHYNDTNGHLVGDQCLFTIAQILANNIWKTDIVARYGGEEFVVLLHGTNKQGAYVAAEKLRKAVEEYNFPYGDKQPLGKVTISIGVSTFPDDGDDSVKLISYADKALYFAKRSGKNKVVLFSKELR
jgi:diguanylate cyclase (GGDEF)-like protein